MSQVAGPSSTVSPNFTMGGGAMGNMGMGMGMNTMVGAYVETGRQTDR